MALFDCEAQKVQYKEEKVKINQYTMGGDSQLTILSDSVLSSWRVGLVI